jgi:hypothetical protein
MTMTPKHSEDSDKPVKRRGHRRATVAGTGPASADGPEPRIEQLNPETPEPSQKKNLSDRDRQILDEKPPHY